MFANIINLLQIYLTLFWVHIPCVIQYCRCGSTPSVRLWRASPVMPDNISLRFWKMLIHPNSNWSWLRMCAIINSINLSSPFEIIVQVSSIYHKHVRIQKPTWTLLVHYMQTKSKRITRTVITRYEGLCCSLKCCRYDGAVAVGEYILRFIVHVLPAVSAGLQTDTHEEH